MIQVAQVKRELGEIVAESPDRIYVPSEGATCTNVRLEHGHWVGDCLIGCWFVRFAGVEPRMLADENCIRLGVGAVLAHLSYGGQRIEISLRAVAFLAAVQSRQDASIPWGECLARTEGEEPRWPDADSYRDFVALSFQPV